MQVTYSAHPNHNSNKILKRISILKYFLQHFSNFLSLFSNILFITLLSDNFNLCFSFEEKHRVSHLYKATCKITFYAFKSLEFWIVNRKIKDSELNGSKHYFHSVFFPLQFTFPEQESHLEYVKRSKVTPNGHYIQPYES
jgi:hypothetical protein